MPPGVNPPRVRRGHGRPTLREVADLAGVTSITVSRYLREPERVAAETAERIREAIAQTGYLPNHQAGGLASGASKMVAALIPNVGHSIFAETIQGLQEGLRQSGHELLLAATDYSMEREEAQLRAVIGWNLGGLIVTGRHHSPGALRLMHGVRAAGTPVIEIWDCAPQTADEQGFAQIGFSHEAVGRAMARHLLAQGHRSLAYVESPVAEDYRAQERGDGFRAETRAAGARTTILRAAAGDVFDAGRVMLERLRQKKHPAITAVAFANDHLACGALMEAQACGLKVPQDLAVLGFGDFPLGRQMRPALSTVRPPRAEIGRAAAAALLRAIESGDEVLGEALPWSLIERDSTLARP